MPNVWIPFLVVCLLATAQAMPGTTLPSILRAPSAPQPSPAADAPIRYDVFISTGTAGSTTRWLYGIVGIDCTPPDRIADPFDKLKSTIGPPLVRS